MTIFDHCPTFPHHSFVIFYLFFTSPYLPPLLEVEITSIALNARWRPLANRHHSKNHRIHKKKSETKGEAPYAEVWIGKLHQSTTRRAALRRRDYFDVRREVLLWGFVERTQKFCCTLMRNTDVPHFIELSAKKKYFLKLWKLTHEVILFSWWYDWKVERKKLTGRTWHARI